MFRRHLALAVLTFLAVPIAASAGPQWGLSVQFGSPNRLGNAYEQGYERGVRAGEEDARRGDRFQFNDEGAYREADAGYRPQFGNRDFYRNEFRRGFEAGYTTAYRNFGRSGRGGIGNGRFGGPWNTPGRGYGRYDAAAQQGYTDGYEAGLDDGQDGRRFDPIRESRYRNGDRGYDRDYGPRELYKTNYRDAFRRGYEDGYADAQRYSGFRR